LRGLRGAVPATGFGKAGFGLAIGIETIEAIEEAQK
jgi:hypothetical protein